MIAVLLAEDLSIAKVLRRSRMQIGFMIDLARLGKADTPSPGSETMFNSSSSYSFHPTPTLGVKVQSLGKKGDWDHGQYYVSINDGGHGITIFFSCRRTDEVFGHATGEGYRR